MKRQNLVVTEKYLKDSIEKKKYTVIGSLITWDNGGQSIQVDVVPIGWNGKASVYEKREREETKRENVSEFPNIKQEEIPF